MTPSPWANCNPFVAPGSRTRVWSPKSSVERHVWITTSSDVIWTRWWIRTQTLVAERVAAGLLDRSVVIDLDIIDADLLPLTVGVSAITMAELAGGPAATSDTAERARRQDRLQRAEAAFESIPVGPRGPPVPTAGCMRLWLPRVVRHSPTKRRGVATQFAGCVATSKIIKGGVPASVKGVRCQSRHTWAT